MRGRFAALLFLLLAGFSATDADAACTGSSPTWSATADEASFEDCITNAVTGDTINVAAGSFTITSTLTVAGKGISIIGAGIGNTVISSTARILMVTPACQSEVFRISGFTFDATGATASTFVFRCFQGASAATVKEPNFRFDHNRHIASTQQKVIETYGVANGLIDNNTFDDTGANPSSFTTICNGYHNDDEDGTTIAKLNGLKWWDDSTWPNGASSWPPVNGVPKQTFFEDNNVNYDTLATAINDLHPGCAMSIRFNTLKNHGHIQTHSSRSGDAGGMWMEVHNNTVTDSDNRFVLQRSGGGVYFMNQVLGTAYNVDIDFQRASSGTCAFSGAPLNTCDGAQAHDADLGGGDYLCVGAPGRVSGGHAEVSDQNWFPVVEFKNGQESTCVTGGTCDDRTNVALNGACSAQLVNYLKTIGSAHANGEVDYISSSNVYYQDSAPATCTKGQGWWETDAGEWNDTNGDTPDGRYHLCTATNTWTLSYMPYTYPHPLQGYVYEGGGGGGGGGSSGRIRFRSAGVMTHVFSVSLALAMLFTRRKTRRS